MQPVLFGHNWKWFLGWGIFLTLLGTAAIIAASFTTWLTIVILGGLLFVTGIVLLVDSFYFWWSKAVGFSWAFIIGALYCLLGLLCLTKPMLAAASFTLILSAFFMVIGMFRIIYTQSTKRPGWGWDLTSGVLSLLLGIIIVMQWPSSSLFIIGLFIGIDLLFLGWSYLMISLCTRNPQKN